MKTNRVSSSWGQSEKSTKMKPSSKMVLNLPIAFTCTNSKRQFNASCDECELKSYYIIFTKYFKIMGFVIFFTILSFRESSVFNSALHHNRGHWIFAWTLVLLPVCSMMLARTFNTLSMMLSILKVIALRLGPKSSNVKTFLKRYYI
jgi:hypothetical protein